MRGSWEKEKWQEFENCICDSGRWGIVALMDYQKRKKIVKDYVSKVGESQEKYFSNILSK